MSCGTTEKKISKKLGNKIIIVSAGKDEKKEEFAVHEDLICSCSEFFRNAMNGNWKESDDRTIPLPGDDPEVFGMYLQACYAGNVQTGEVNSDAEANYETNLAKDVIVWAEVYALADKLMDTDAKNVVTKAIYDTRYSIWSVGASAGRAITSIYESSSPECGIRQLLIDSAVYKRSEEELPQFRAALAEAPPEFLEDLACSMTTRIVTTTGKAKQGCRCEGEGWDGRYSCHCDELAVHVEKELYDYLDMKFERPSFAADDDHAEASSGRSFGGWVKERKLQV